MQVNYRLARRDDLSEVATVRAEAFNDLNRRRGFADQQLPAKPPHPFFEFALEEEREGFWVAEIDSRGVGMALCWVCDRYWFLGYLFVLPDYQNQGIGHTLLKKALSYVGQGSVDNRALITMAYNPVSMGLYMRHGMYPSVFAYRMVGQAALLRERSTVNHFLEAEEMDARLVSVSELTRLDQEVLGISRERHHRFFLSRTEATCFLFRAEGQTQGYAYVWPDGQVGPLAARTTESFRDISVTSLHRAAMRSPSQVSILVPGTNRQAIEIAFNNHLEMVLPFIFFSSKPLPSLENYLLHSPGLM